MFARKQASVKFAMEQFRDPEATSAEQFVTVHGMTLKARTMCSGFLGTHV